ncbi:MAG: thiol-disulfide oxidoreductase DCC family protein [Bdellovibrionales bacterium]
MKRATIIYDGDCGICERFRQVVERLDWKKRFECRPLQEDTVYSQFPLLSPAECQKELKLIEHSDSIRVHGGAEAVIRICLQLPLMKPVGFVLLLAPFRKLTGYLYGVVADHRNRISSACGLKRK